MNAVCGEINLRDLNKLKIDKKEAYPKGLLHQFFRKCPYTYCACSYTNRSYTNRVRTTLSIILILLYRSLEK